MPKYFMGGTRLGGLERMMMDPSRSPHSHADPQRKRPQKKLPCDRSAAAHFPKRKVKEGGA